MLTHLSLFTGIGGLDLAAEWAGFTTVGQCEWADYPTRVLEKHWADVPKWRDVRDVTRDALAKKSIEEITVLSGGFPCQPHSLAGNRMADRDERDLWGEFARVIREVMPRWVVAENVYGLLSSDNGRFFGRVLRDLAQMGYDASWGVLSAFAAGAAHERERVFIVAHSNSERWLGVGKDEPGRSAHWVEKDYEEIQPNKILGLYANAERLLSHPVSGVCRNDDGISEGLDRFKCVGNAVSPQQAYPIFAAIAEIEAVHPTRAGWADDDGGDGGWAK